MKILFALVLLTLPLAAQVSVVCTPSPLEYSYAVLDKTSAPNLQHWACVVENRGLGPATVQEAKVQAWMMRQGVGARSSRTVRLGVGEIQRKRWPKTVGRIFLNHAPSIVMGLMALDGIKIGEPWARTAVGLSGFAFPLIGSAAETREVDPAVFEQVVMQGDATLAPGQSVEIAMFAVPLEQPPLNLVGELPMPAQLTLRDIGAWDRAPSTAEIWAMAIGQRMAGLEALR